MSLPFTEVRGLAPDHTPLGGEIQFELGTQDLPVPVKLRASDALICARRLGFRLFGTPADITDEWDEEIRAKGQAVDRAAKAAITRLYDGRTDVAFDLLPEFALGGYGDAVYGTDPVVAVEVKSVSTKKMMGLLGNWQHTPAGPDAAYICQGALLGVAVGADVVHIIVVDRDDATRLPAEWIIGMDDPLPHLPIVGVSDDGEIISETPRHMAIKEARRQTNVLRVVEAGRLPRREIPGYGVVLYPPAAGQQGDPFQCKFCPWQPTCSRAGVDEVEDWASAS